MINDIILSFKDLYKDKVFVIFYVLFFSSIMITITSTSQSIIREGTRTTNASNANYTDFNTYVIGLTPDKPEELLENLSIIYKNDSYTSCYLQLNTNEHNKVNTYLIFGDISKKYPFLASNNDFSIILGKDLNNIHTIYLNGSERDINTRLETSHIYEIEPYLSESTDSLAFIIIKSPKLLNWIDANNHEVIYEIIKNTHISSDKRNLVDTFLKYANSNFVKVEENNYNNTNMKAERSFITKSIYPLLFIMLLCCFLSSSIILDGIIKKRTKEYTLYLLHGAKLSNIITRLLFYFVIIIFNSIVLCIIITSPKELRMYSLLGFIITILFALLIISKLKKKDLYANLRIGGQE